MSHQVFMPDAVARLATAYPESPQRLEHGLAGHPLLDPEALIALAERMRPQDTLCFRGDVPVGVGKDGAPRNGLGVAETVRSIETNKSWMVLKAVDQDAAYRVLLDELLAEIESVARPATGAMLRREAFIFVSSPGSVTPFHLDPEHNILLQISGEKIMTVFPQDDEELASGEAQEAFHAAGDYTLGWREEFAPRGTAYRLAPGDALYVPVKAPHWVKNGDAPSISLSITWRSEWSYEEADARAFNSLLRRVGLKPRAPGRWPRRNTAKAIGWRLYRKFVKSR